jgi:hypothetical protein
MNSNATGIMLCVLRVRLVLYFVQIAMPDVGDLLSREEGLVLGQKNDLRLLHLQVF